EVTRARNGHTPVQPGERRISTCPVNPAKDAGLIVVVGQRIIRPYRPNRRVLSKRANLPGGRGSTNHSQLLIGYAGAYADSAEQVKVRASETRTGVKGNNNDAHAGRVRKVCQRCRKRRADRHSRSAGANRRRRVKANSRRSSKANG